MRRSVKLLLLLAALFFCLPASGQKKDGFFRDLDDFLDMRSDKSYAKLDSTYVGRYDYIWDGRTFFKSTGMRFVSSFADSRMTTGMVQRIGLGVSYRGLGLSYSHILGKKKHNNEFMLSFYGRHLGVEYDFRSVTQPMANVDYPGMEYKDGRIDNLVVFTNRLNVFYCFNSRFSYAAAMKQNRIQRRSAGSFIAGISWAAWDMLFVGDEDKDAISTFFKANYFYQRFSLGAGYGYNLVFGQRHWLLHMSVIPMWSFYEMQGWWDSGVRETESYPFGHIAFAGTARTGIFYRWGTRWSLGFSGIVNQVVTMNRFSRKSPEYSRFGGQDWQIDLSLVCRF